MKRKTKQTLKSILLGALGIGAIVGVASGVNSLVEKNDTELKVIHPTFEIGGLNASGEHEESKQTIYTKTAFECQGLEINLDFDNHISYQVFFYESDGDFISASEVYTDNTDFTIPQLATHARVEVTPLWDEMGEDYEEEENQIIKWYETTKYSSQLEIQVNKEQQELVLLNLINKDWLVVDSVSKVQFTSDIRYRVRDSVAFDYNPSDTTGYYGSDGYLIKVKGGETITFNNVLSKEVEYSLWQFTGDTLDLNMSVLGSWVSGTTKLDDNTDYVVISVKTKDASALNNEEIAKIQNCFTISK